ncbi:MAG: hypothetical protein HC906_19615 [Bacteroidales bacterium]|nr:hypothetical protein [Bacteroidales bacterium]
MGDVFEDKIKSCREELKKTKKTLTLLMKIVLSVLMHTRKLLMRELML